MTVGELTLTELAQKGDFRTLEDRWLDAIENVAEEHGDLLGALTELNKCGKKDQASALGWTWLTSAREKAEPKDALAIGRELGVRCKDNEEIRQELLRLYEEVHADRAELTQLIEASGLAGGKTIRRALRTLEICLGLTVGDYLLSRSDEHAAEVTGIDLDACLYTVQAKYVEQEFDPDALALAYDPVEPNDFRALAQLHPDKIGELLEEDPVTLLLGILQSHHGRLDQDQLEHLLSPRFIPPERWSKWWTKARTAVKRCLNIVIEGRNPVILTYHAAGQSLEDEIEPQWSKATTSAERLTVIESYFREAKTRQFKVSTRMTERFHRDLLVRLEAGRRESPSAALTEALIIDRLAEGAETAGDESLARDMIAGSSDLIDLMGGLTEYTLYLRSLKHIRDLKSEVWPAIFADLLPFAPRRACEFIAKSLDYDGQRDLLNDAAARIPADFSRHLDAICWLWKGPTVKDIEPISPGKLLPLLLNHLSELSLNDSTPPDVLRDARLKIRASLSASKFTRYREVIEGMESGLASTVHRTIDRTEGLGQVVHSTLLTIIQNTHPGLFTKPKIDPWFDESILFATQPGMEKRESELNHLVNVKMPENAKAIGDAAAHGDLSENSEYKFALEERDLLRARVALIQNEMSLARLVTVDDVLADAVNVGTRVTLQATGEAAKGIDVTVLGPWEANLEKRIYNYRAPLCEKLKDLRVGDTVTLNLEGQEKEYRVEAIVNALEE